jgi:hypothetical protein
MVLEGFFLSELTSNPQARRLVLEGWANVAQKHLCSFCLGFFCSPLVLDQFFGAAPIILANILLDFYLFIYLFIIIL